MKTQKTKAAGKGAKRAVRVARGPRPAALGRDPRLPSVGSTIRRDWHGKRLEVKVTKDGFTFRGKTYASLSAVAKSLVKCEVNGFAFFGLTKRAAAPSSASRARPAAKAPRGKRAAKPLVVPASSSIPTSAGGDLLAE